MYRASGRVKTFSATGDQTINIHCSTQAICKTRVSLIYLGYNYPDKQVVVLRLSTSYISEKENPVFKRLGQLLHHPGSVNLLIPFRLTTINSPTNTYLITHFCNNGTLAQFLKAINYRMTFSQAVHLTLDLFKAFQSLAEIGVMHNDIKESNIFINKGLALIGDFNKSDLCQIKKFKQIDLRNIAKICLKMFSYVPTSNLPQCFKSIIQPRLFRAQEGFYSDFDEISQIIEKFGTIVLEPRKAYYISHTEAIRRSLQDIFLYGQSSRQTSILMVSSQSLINNEPTQSFKTLIETPHKKGLLNLCQYLMNCIQQVEKQFKPLKVEEQKQKYFLNSLTIKFIIRIITVIKSQFHKIKELPEEQAKFLQCLKQTVLDQEKKHKQIDHLKNYYEKIKDFSLPSHYLAIHRIARKILKKLGRPPSQGRIPKVFTYLFGTINIFQLENEIQRAVQPGQLFYSVRKSGLMANLEQSEFFFQ